MGLWVLRLIWILQLNQLRLRVLKGRGVVELGQEQAVAQLVSCHPCAHFIDLDHSFIHSFHLPLLMPTLTDLIGF